MRSIKLLYYYTFLLDLLEPSKIKDQNDKALNQNRKHKSYPTNCNKSTDRITVAAGTMDQIGIKVEDKVRPLISPVSYTQVSQGSGELGSVLVEIST